MNGDPRRVMRLAILFGSLPAGAIAALLTGSRWALPAVVLLALVWVFGTRLATRQRS